LHHCKILQIFIARFLGTVYPPTPADARGSAPGNNTFDPFFERKEQEQQEKKVAKIIIFYGFQKLR
jgi:hypothetical protein